MNQIAVLSDERKAGKAKTPKFDQEIERRMKELQEYKGEK